MEPMRAVPSSAKEHATSCVRPMCETRTRSLIAKRKSPPSLRRVRQGRRGARLSRRAEIPGETQEGHVALVDTADPTARAAWAADATRTSQDEKPMLLSIDDSRNVLVAFPATGEAYAVPAFTPGKLEASTHWTPRTTRDYAGRAFPPRPSRTRVVRELSETKRRERPIVAATSCPAPLRWSSIPRRRRRRSPCATAISTATACWSRTTSFLRCGGWSWRASRSSPG